VGNPDDIVAAAQVVEQILGRMLPGWRGSVPEDSSHRWQQERQAAQRAIVQLDELRETLGDNAPQLDAARMHPWVWQGARSLWQSGHLREAVRAASVKLNAEAQNKLGRRDVTETELFQSAYSKDDPKPGPTAAPSCADSRVDVGMPGERAGGSLPAKPTRTRGYSSRHP